MSGSSMRGAAKHVSQVLFQRQRFIVGKIQPRVVKYIASRTVYEPDVVLIAGVIAVAFPAALSHIQEKGRRAKGCSCL